MQIRSIIVDDEPLARERVRQFLSAEPDVDILCECECGPEAVEAIRNLRPNLVFLDIQMQNMDGFQVLEELDRRICPQVIFTTAYDRFALKAFSVHALDYLLKPFERERFQVAIQRCRKAIQSADLEEMNSKFSALLESVRPNRTYLTRFCIEEGGHTVYLKVDDVECIEATGNYMHLYNGTRPRIIRDSLVDLESRLDPAQFLRAHRSWILNVDKLRELHHFHKDRYLAVMQSGMKVPVSLSFRKRLEEVLNGQS